MGLEVHCINSGQGNSIALQLPDDSFMVVDIDCHGDTPVDSTVLFARGGAWHKKDREAGIVPHSSMDTEAGWTRCY